MKLLLSLLCSLFCANVLYGAEDPFLREPVTEGIKAIYDLEYGKAQRIFDQLKKDHPDSPVGYGMTAIRAWHELLFSARNMAIYKYGIPTPFDDVEPQRNKSTSAIEKTFTDANKQLEDFCDTLLKKNPQNPLALYFKGVVYENLSTQALTLTRSKSQALDHAKEAGKIHRHLLELDPNFFDAKTSTAVPEYVIGSNILLKFFSIFLGVRGDKKGAIAKLEEVGKKGIYRATDAKVVLALLEAWKGDPKRAITLFESMRSAHPRNFMYDISLAIAYEEAARDSKSAIRVYQGLLRDLPSKAPGIQPGEIHLRIAKNYMILGDSTQAFEQFQQAAQTSQADPETKPLAFYGMAGIYEDRKDKANAKKYYRLVAEYTGPTALIQDEIKRAKRKFR